MVDIYTSQDTITVIVGIDGAVPPRDIRMDVESLVNGKVNREANLSYTRDSAILTVNEYPSEEVREILGGRTQYTMAFDIDLGDVEINQDVVNAAHNTVVEVLTEHGFNVTGTSTIWDGSVQL